MVYAKIISAGVFILTLIASTINEFMASHILFSLNPFEVLKIWYFSNPLWLTILYGVSFAACFILFATPYIMTQNRDEGKDNE